MVSNDFASLGSPSNPIIIHLNEDSAAIAQEVRHYASGLPNKSDIEIAKSGAKQPLPYINNTDIRIDCISLGGPDCGNRSIADKKVLGAYR